jgi:hypothetical protein
MGPKIFSAPTKTVLPYNFCLINFLPSLTLEAVDAPQTLFRAPLDPASIYIYIYIYIVLYILLAGSTRHCPGHYIKIIKCVVRAKVATKVSPKVLHLLFNKLCLKMTDHGSRSTKGPGPSRSRLRAQKYDLLPPKQTFPTTLCFIY